MKSCSITLLLLLLFVGVSANEAFSSTNYSPLFHPRHRTQPIISTRNIACHAASKKGASTTFLEQQKNRLTSSVVALRGGAFIPGQEVLTFGQNLAGSVFSTFAIMYGLACSFAPKRTARLFYGYDDTARGKDHAVGKFLMRLIGSITCGLGLSAAFAIGSEMEQLGHVPSLPVLEHAFGIGLIPRLLFMMHTLLMGIPSKLRINRVDIWVLLAETVFFMSSLFTGRMLPELVAKFEVTFCLLLGPLFFFQPSLLFKKDDSPSAHEKLMARLVASYTIMSAVMLASLMNPAINALPSLGFTALTWVTTLLHITFVSRDVKECGSSTSAHIAMIAGGLAVAAGGLRHYLVT